MTTVIVSPKFQVVIPKEIRELIQTCHEYKPKRKIRQSTMRTNIVLNNDLIREATMLTGITTTQELIELALRELIHNKKKKNLYDLADQIDFTDYGYKSARELRIKDRKEFVSLSGQGHTSGWKFNQDELHK